MIEFISYARFTGPQNRDRAINTLIGIIQGVLADGKVSEKEKNEIKEWISDFANMLHAAPFDEISEKIKKIIEDGNLDLDELEDMLWALNNCRLESQYYDDITRRIQELHGILHGIISDGQIEFDELKGLHAWISKNEDLKGTYPYDEIESVCISALADGKIDEKEHAELMRFFEEFISYSLSKRIKNAFSNLESGSQDDPQIMKGICAINPDVQFSGKIFVLTGGSIKATRTEITEIIERKSGRVSSGLVKADYLIICNEGNRAWAFSCYGRKVEKAMQLRKAGARIIIVNEIDFWDSI